VASQAETTTAARERSANEQRSTPDMGQVSEQRQDQALVALMPLDSPATAAKMDFGPQ